MIWHESASVHRAVAESDSDFSRVNHGDLYFPAHERAPLSLEPLVDLDPKFKLNRCANRAGHRNHLKMSGTPNLREAARRHFRCAEHLAEKKEQSEASYLMGLAAECAVKAHLVEVDFPLMRSRRKRDQGRDPAYVHFPELATELAAQGEGVLARAMMVALGDPSLLNGWHVKMRYRHEASGPAVRKRYALWREQTLGLFKEVAL